MHKKWILIFMAGIIILSAGCAQQKATIQADSQEKIADKLVYQNKQLSGLKIDPGDKETQYVKHDQAAVTKTVSKSKKPVAYKTNLAIKKSKTYVPAKKAIILKKEKIAVRKIDAKTKKELAKPTNKPVKPITKATNQIRKEIHNIESKSHNTTEKIEKKVEIQQKHIKKLSEKIIKKIGKKPKENHQN